MTWPQELKKAFAANPGKSLADVVPIAKENWARVKQQASSTGSAITTTITRKRSPKSRKGKKSRRARATRSKGKGKKGKKGKKTRGKRGGKCGSCSRKNPKSYAF